MTEQQWYAGVDWASESHHVFLTDGTGRKIGEKIFKHSGEGLAEMAAWLLTASGAASSSQIYVAIEVPHGPVVETLIERGFTIHAINPKQMDRFRDRFTLAGAKDDSRDAEVMASALRTDPHCLRLLIAVGMRIASHPPHRSEQAQLRHSAPTLGAWRRSAQQARDEGFSVSGGSPQQVSPSASRAYHPSRSAA